MYYGAKKSKQNSKNLALFQDFFKECKILTISEITAIHYSSLKMKLKSLGKPIPENDLWIAANSIEYTMTLVTRDSHLLQIDSIDKLKI